MVDSNLKEIQGAWAGFMAWAGEMKCPSCGCKKGFDTLVNDHYMGCQYAAEIAEMILKISMKWALLDKNEKEKKI